MMMMQRLNSPHATYVVRTKLPMLNSANYNDRTWLLAVMIT